MPTTVVMEYIELDDNGNARLKAHPRIKVKHLVGVKETNNMTMEELCDGYPHVSPAEIYAVYAYYLDHKEEIDLIMEEDDRESIAAWEAQKDDPRIKRLRAIKEAKIHGS